MRIRSFYPRQVANRLTGKHPENLSSGERAALRFFVRKGRKMGVGIQIPQTNLADYKSAGAEEAAVIRANTNTRIIMSTQAQ